MITQKQFSTSSKNFWFQAVLLVLSIAAGLGIKLPSSPELITTDLLNTFSTSGIYAVAGILIVSIIAPVYNFVKSKPKLSLTTFLADPNNIVYIVSFAASVLVLLGVAIPDGTAEQIVRAVMVRDWAAIGSVGLSSIIVPLVRYFIDRAASKTIQV